MSRDCSRRSDDRPGYSAGVEVGGNSDPRIRGAMVEEIKRHLRAVALPGHCVDVTLTGPGTPRAGAHVDNLINWLAIDGVHIEQSYTARKDYAAAIADAVAQVYAGMCE